MGVYTGQNRIPYRYHGFTARSLIVCVLLLALASCGRATPLRSLPGNTTSTVATSVSPSTPSPSPTGNANAFGPNDCTYQSAGGAITGPAPDTFQTVITIPSGWTSNNARDGIFSLSAPSTYSNQPTTVSLSAPLPTDSSVTPSSFLSRMIQGSVTPTSVVQTCTVGLDKAAFVSYTTASNSGYLVLWFHFGNAYLFRLDGVGGVDPRAIADAKGILASVTYRHNIPPPGYTPTP